MIWIHVRRFQYWIGVAVCVIIIVVAIRLRPTSVEPAAPIETPAVDASPGKIRETKQKRIEILSQLDVYFFDCNVYPKHLGELVRRSKCRNWGGPYLKEPPADGWGNPFFYKKSGKTFILKSLGADNKEGGTGPDADIL